MVQRMPGGGRTGRVGSCLSGWAAWCVGKVSVHVVVRSLELELSVIVEQQAAAWGVDESYSAYYVVSLESGNPIAPKTLERPKVFSVQKFSKGRDRLKVFKGLGNVFGLKSFKPAAKLIRKCLVKFAVLMLNRGQRRLLSRAMRRRGHACTACRD